MHNTSHLSPAHIAPAILLQKMASNIPKLPYDDDITPSEPPPSYAEALNSTPVLPNRPTGNPHQQTSSSNYRPSNGPPMPQRPSSNYQSHQGGGGLSSASHQNHQSGLGGQMSSLYSNNPDLPFQYPRKYFCKKCLNTGFKIKNRKPCRDCWDSLFLNNHAYNPNPNLPFRYPKRFLCEKCVNTGSKLKNGLTCQDCYARFAPRNNVTATYSGGGFLGPSFPPPFMPNLGPGGAIRVPPGDPRLGGILCGNCRGSGQVYFLLDLELCPVCGGLGRLINTNPSQQTGFYR